MNTKRRPLLRSVRRARDVFAAYVPKSEVAELAALHKDLDDAIGQLTGGASDREAITMQSRVQTMELKRRGSALREGSTNPIVYMSRTMRLVINDTEMTFVLPNPIVDKRIRGSFASSSGLNGSRSRRPRTLHSDPRTRPAPRLARCRPRGR